MPLIHNFIRHAQFTARAQGRKHRLKKPGRLLPALAIELGYAAQIHKRQAEFQGVINRIVVPRIAPMVKRAGIIKLDAWDNDLDQAIELARATFNGIAPQQDIENLVLQYAQQTSKFQADQLRRSLQDAIGVNVFLNDRKLLARMRTHVKQNVDLITSIEDDLLGDIKTRLTTGIRKGVRVEELRDMIEERYDVSRSRASLIARDQTGKFYGELNRDRQESLGMTEYTWRGVGDERERAMHVALEGEVFAWGSPPVTNADGDKNEPGGDYQCRCVGEPILPYMGL